MTDETAWRERALRAEKELGDAWEVVGASRAGHTSSRVEFGPVGGPYVTVEEARSYTLPEFLAEVTAVLEEDRKYIDSVRAERNRLAREARAVTAEQLEAAAVELYRDPHENDPETEDGPAVWSQEEGWVRALYRARVAHILTAAGFTVPEEVQP